MSDTSPSSHRWNKAFLLGGVLFGVICFFAGRFTVQQSTRQIAPNKTTDSISSATIANESVGKTVTASAAEPNSASATTDWNKDQWQEIVSQPGSPARNAAMAAMLEKLAASDPDRAMKLAQTEGNLLLRDNLVQASLHGWARTSPTNAANWALALTDSNDRERALATVFAGQVANNPEGAVQFGKNLIQTLAQKNPADAASYGTSLIEALCSAGNFETAARMAGEGDKDLRSNWMANSYSKWAEFQPEQAAQAAAAIDDPELRNQALHGIVGGWAEADPAALIKFVTQLPADTDKGAMLSQSLQRWVRHDPAAASEWMNNRAPGPDMDAGVAAVSTMETLKPDVAVGWAESVVSPKLRSETLVTLLRNWATTDLAAARHYFETTTNLLPEDRQEIAGVIATLSGQSPAQ